MIKNRVLCNDCLYFLEISQACCLNPQPIKKDRSDWCAQAYPHYEIDPGIAKLYVGLLRTIHRHVKGLLEDGESLEGRIPNLTAWLTQAEKVLDGEEQPTTQGTIIARKPEFTPSPKKFRAMLNTGFGMQTIEIDSADELAQTAVPIAVEIRTNQADGNPPSDKTSFPFQFSAIDGSTKGWFGMLHYEWSDEPLLNFRKYRDCYYRAIFENTTGDDVSSNEEDFDADNPREL